MKTMAITNLVTKLDLLLEAPREKQAGVFVGHVSPNLKLACHLYVADFHTG